MDCPKIETLAALAAASMAVMLLLTTPLSARSHPSLPKRIAIQDKWFRVYESSKTPEDFSLTVGNWGVCNCKAAYIQIDPDQTDAQKRDTLWHEVNHGLNDCDTQFWKYVDYDNLFSDMIPAQLQVLRDNPQLVKFLLAGRSKKH